METSDPGSWPRFHGNGFVTSRLPAADKRIVDVGCGTGGLVRSLAKRGARVTGIEVLPEILAVAMSRPRVGGEQYLQGHAQSLPLLDGVMDAVIFNASLHHVPEGAMGKALAEAWRVLKPGGCLYVDEPIPEGEYFRLNRLVEDETAILARAQETLSRAPALGFATAEEVFYIQALTFAGFDAFRKASVTADYRRVSAFERNRDALFSRFHQAGKPIAEGYRFLCLMHAKSFTKPA